MIIENSDIYSTFWNLITFILQFLTNNIPFFLLLFIGIWVVGFIWKILTLQRL